MTQRPTVGLVRCAIALAPCWAGCVSMAHVTAAEPTPAAAEDDMSRPFLAPLELTSDPLEDAIVRVVGGVSCSGTVIAPDLVLTAHHCVAKRDARGAVLHENMEPGRVTIELGGDDLPWAVVGVRAIVAPECGYEQGSGDIALLVLERELAGWPTLSVRMHQPPTKKESVTPWGFGRCASSHSAIRRHDREGGAIDHVTSGTFEAEASICPGDSGGPVLDDKRQLVGVVSAAVMDTDDRTKDRAHFARIDGLPLLFSAAREIANGGDPNELPPFRACSTSP